MNKSPRKAHWSLTVFLALASVWLLGCRSTTPALQRYEFAEPQMGLPFRMVFYATAPSRATNASRLAFERISELNGVMSDYDPESELSRLSRTAGSGQAVSLSADLWKVLYRAQEVSSATDGAFDVTVGPVVNLWRRARRQRELPEPARLEAARHATGWENLQLDPDSQTATLTFPNMRLDLGGIAKGYAVDEAMKVLKRNGVRSALVSGGGDMALSEPPPGQKGWKIEVMTANATPTDTQREFLLLSNCALATSGDLFQFVEINGKRYSHIVNPRTGVGLTDQSLVNVIAPNCMTADAYSTAISVMGEQKARAFAKRPPAKLNFRVIYRSPTTRTVESDGFQKFLLKTQSN